MEDKYLKEKFKTLKNNEFKPSAQVWNTLESKLYKEKKSRFQNRFNIAVAASLVVIFSLLISQMVTYQNPEKQTAEKIDTPIKKDTITKSQDTTNH